MNNNGYIYVLMNPSLQNMVKIGKTTRTPEERAKELSASTGVPTPFVVVYSYKFEDCSIAENFIHTYLESKGFRVSTNREFFEIPINEAIDSVIKAKEHFGEFVETSKNDVFFDKSLEVINLYQNELYPQLNLLIQNDLINENILSAIELINTLIENEFVYFPPFLIGAVSISIDDENLLEVKYSDKVSYLLACYDTHESHNTIIDTANNILNIISQILSNSEDEKIKSKCTLFSIFITSSLENNNILQLVSIIFDFNRLILKNNLKDVDEKKNDIEPEFFYIACKYFNGEDDYLQDYKEAEKYFRKAILVGSTFSYSYLSMIYRYGLGTKVDLNLSLDYCKQAVNKGLIHNYESMSEIYLELNHIDNAIKCWEKYVSECRDDEDLYSSPDRYNDLLIELNNRKLIENYKIRLKSISDKIYISYDNHLRTFLENEERLDYLTQIKIRDTLYPHFLN